MSSEANALRGKRYFVSGGTSGIGLGIAARLHALGAAVVLNGRDPDRAAAAAARLSPEGERVETLCADVRDADALGEALSGAFDGAVLAAAGNFVASAETLSPGGFRAVVDIDLMGTFNVARALVSRLTPEASLLVVSAPQAARPMQGQSHVSAAKAGVEALARSLALEWGPKGIRVNIVVPGAVAGTEGVERLLGSEEATRAFANRLPLRRLGRVEDIADAAAFLLSSRAAYITGATLTCDGGLSLV